MERHTIMIHKLIYINKKQTTENTNLPTENTNLPTENTNILKLHCTKCNKNFKRSENLNYHIEICKSISNPLECHLCHKNFSTSGSKSRHIKICKSKTLITIDNNINDTIINNGTINNINNINNGTINNNNITVLSFGDGKDIQFMNDHITAKMLTQMYSDGNTADGLRQYMQKLLEVPENRLVKKTNAKQAFSKVHCGNGNWETRLDQDIYPKLVNQMANDNWDKIRYYNESNSIKLRENLTKRLLDNLEVLTSWDRPDDYEDEQKRTFKQTIGMLKLLVLDISKL
jgi:hypothetical protein